MAHYDNQCTLQSWTRINMSTSYTCDESADNHLNFYRCCTGKQTADHLNANLVLPISSSSGNISTLCSADLSVRSPRSLVRLRPYRLPRFLSLYCSHLLVGHPPLLIRVQIRTIRNSIFYQSSSKTESNRNLLVSETSFNLM